MIGPKWVTALVAGLILVTGCTGGAIHVVYYTLQPSVLAPAMEVSKAVEIGVGPVMLPDYLDRSTLVTRVSPNQLKLHQGHHWAGALQKEILRVVSANLKSACPGVTVRSHPWYGSDPPAVRFRLSIQSFEGRPGGEVDLTVAWYVENMPADQVPLRRETHVRCRVNGNDLESYAAAMGRALAGLTREMAKDVAVIAEGSSNH